MSDVAINAGYVPEEHAPDPVASHGDPIPPGKLAIWLFLASEVMFFIGLLGTYIVLRSGSPRLFAAHGAMLSKALAGLNTLVLIFSSLTMALAVDAAQKQNRPRLIATLLITVICAFGFMGIKTIEYSDKFHHYTILAKEGTGSNIKYFIYDGHIKERMVTVNGKISMPAGTRFVKLDQQQGNYAPETVGAVVGKNGDRLKVKIDDSAGEEIDVPSSAVSDVEVNAIKDKSFKFEAHRRQVGAKEEINVHTYTPTLDAAEEHEGGNATAGEMAAAPNSEQKGPGVKEPAVNKEHEEQEYTINASDINDMVWYGPQKSIFYSCYFALTGVHGLHVIGGIIPLTILLIQALRGKFFAATTEYVGLYWHFVDLVWIFLFPLLYLI